MRDGARELARLQRPDRGDGVPERLEMIFEDGFESGDTSVWTSTVP